MIDSNAALFLDTNTLVQANIRTAPRHREAILAFRRLRGAKTKLWINRQVLREYLSVVTRPQSFMQPMDSAQAASRIVYFQSHFHIAEDNAKVTTELVSLLKTIPLGGKQVHDANIVATMLAYGIRQILTSNSVDFARFSDLIVLLSLENVLLGPGPGT